MRDCGSEYHIFYDQIKLVLFYQPLQRKTQKPNKQRVIEKVLESITSFDPLKLSHLEECKEEGSAVLNGFKYKVNRFPNEMY